MQNKNIENYIVYQDVFIKLSKENCNDFIKDIMKQELMPINEYVSIADLIYLLECQQERIEKLKEELRERWD